jgi:hypothetical protein
MIDLTYKTLLTILNKEQAGWVSPEEFNILANLIQTEIFRSYFTDENRDKNKQNRGLTNGGYSNLPFNERQRITAFADSTTVALQSEEEQEFATLNLPEDLYFIEDQGILSKNGKVIEEVENKTFGYLSNSISAAGALYPIYTQQGNVLKVYPKSTQSPVMLNYIKNPKAPKWTYVTLKGDPLFNPSAPDFQDFELHESEFPNIVLKMLSHFGITLRETEVVQMAEGLKQQINVKDNS